MLFLVGIVIVGSISQCKLGFLRRRKPVQEPGKFAALVAFFSMHCLD
jgi:hypothetical protein